jgi:sugar phosphate isomerase/epimerase
VKPIGIQLYTVRERAQTNLFGVLKELASIGYRGVELAGLHGHKPAEVRKALDDLGLAVCSAHGAAPTRGNLDQLADEARTLGYDTLICGRAGEDFASRENILKAAGELEQACRLLRSQNLRLAYHNHWWEFDLVEGRPGLQLLLEKAPGLSSQLDVYWASNFGRIDVPAFIAAHRARIPSLHVKDGPLVQEAPHTAVGSGKMDIAKCVQAADPAVLEWVIVELDSCATDMMTAVRESYRYLVSNALAEGAA